MFQLKGTSYGSGSGILNHVYSCQQGIYVNLSSGTTVAKGSLACSIRTKNNELLPMSLSVGTTTG